MLQRLSNPAAEIGAQRFSWWQDWRSQAVAIVACGPSAKNADVCLLRGRVKVLAIKEAFTRLVPFADAVYGCDGPWWNHVQGLPDFKGLKLAWDGSKIAHPGVNRFKLRSRYLDKIIVDEPGVIGAGGHSGFQALNIAVQFGAARVLLVGFDIRDDKQLHFYGRNSWAGANNPNPTVWKRWVSGMDGAAVTLRDLAVEVLNASPVSAVNAFRKVTIAQALSEWNL